MSNRMGQQYVCPNCFAQRSVNDIYFRTSARTGAADLCQTKLARRLQPDGQEPCSVAGWQLARWQEYPASQRIMDDEVIVGLRDYNGEELGVRVCPRCHYPLTALPQQAVTLLPWDENGLAFSRADALFQNLTKDPVRWEIGTAGGDPDNAVMVYHQVKTPYGVLGYPAGLPEKDAPRSEQIRRRYIRRANAAVLWLELESPDPWNGGSNGDPQTIWAVQNYLNTAEDADETFRPTVLFLRLPPEDGATRQTFGELLQKNHRNLCHALQLRFQCCRVLPWLDEPAIAGQAVQWIMTGGAAQTPPAAPPNAAGPGDGDGEAGRN